MTAPNVWAYLPHPSDSPPMAHARARMLRAIMEQWRDVRDAVARGENVGVFAEVARG